MMPETQGAGTLEQIRAFLDGSIPLGFEIPSSIPYQSRPEAPTSFVAHAARARTTITKNGDPMNDIDLRRRIIHTCREMNRLGINQGTSGNIGARFGDGFLVTPSGMPYDAMEADDVVEMDFQGACQGKRLPSVEWRIHRDILQTRDDIGVVIHAHSMFCTTLAIHGRAIPAAHYLVALAGGDDIPCVPYAPPMSQALSDAVVPALAERRACLMAHHGVIAIGAGLEETLALLMEVETLAAQYWRALQIGPPPVLGDEEMREIRGILREYGQQK
uniref:L-fuculose-phosphate aldolase n=1 Tax=Candidatus Kentrum sp. SD TaxID=2126332 RepID=A0A451BNZ3_9GAMM|nr:MAG: L-fuculose-phosphate aldolase [Candidatus Kentron sp. SD]